MKMKLYLYSILILLLAASAPSHAQKIDWDEVREAYFTKYQPTDTPAWIFPIVFEEGNGGRDTLYFGYDPSASHIFPVDKKFGEYDQLIDSSKFNSRWGFSSKPDSGLKINMQGNSFNGTGISFYNGILPLTMWWDKEAFYSDTLPFKDQSPAPRAMGGISYDFPMYVEKCSFEFGIFLTDTMESGECIRTDSIYFVDTDNRGNISIHWINFYLIEWRNFQGGSVIETGKFPALVFPNPAKDFLNIKFKTPQTFKAEIIDITGKVHVRHNFENSISSKMSTGNIPAAVYFLRVTTEQDKIFNKKIIIRP